ncbi:MAG TPA: TetR/AcrR family transcriptional regulator [Gaiellaceae bacterium]|nr:TetR/AcrR family transcriptional regulator [Gaiellaceae bacterium]
MTAVDVKSAPERGEARRRQLLAAADRVVRRRGPDASMDEIAAEAGVTKPILYRHFGDKDGLYAALTERYLRLLHRDSEATLGEPNPRRRIAAAVSAFLAAVEREPEVFRFVRRATTEQRQAGEAARAFVQGHAARIAEATRADLERIGVDPEAAEPWAHGIVGMMQFVAGWWLDERSVPRERLADQMTTLLWEGFGHLHEH